MPFAAIVALVLIKGAPPGPQPPADAEAAATLARLAAHMAAVQTLTAPLTQVKRLAAFVTPQEAHGALAFARPDRLRLELDGPGGTILIVDRELLTLHYKALARTERLSLRDVRARAIAEHLFLLVEADPQKLAEVYRVEVRAAAPAYLRLVPKAEALARLVAWIDARFDAQDVVRQVIVREPSGDETEWRVATPVLNAPLGDERFRLPS